MEHHIRPGTVLLAGCQLFLFSFSGPLLWLADNTRNQPDYGDAILIALIVFVAACSAASLQVRLGADSNRALAMTSIGLIVFWNWKSLALPIAGIPGWAFAVVTAIMLVAAAWLYGERYLWKHGLLAIGATLACVSLGIVLQKTLPDTPRHILAPTSSSVVTTLERRPDIYLMVLDAYARADVLDEVYGYNNQAFLTTLAEEGFDVAPQSTSNYSITHFSLASLLSMEYVMEPGPVVTRADLAAIRSILSGENRFSRLIASLGYEQIRGSEAWWGTECSEVMEVCLSNPMLSRTAFELLAGTPLGPVVYGKAGDVGTALTLKRLEQIRSWSAGSSAFGTSAPDFVLLHLGIPHPPLFLDSSCQPRKDLNLEGHSINRVPSYPANVLEVRRRAYVDQVECANLIATELIRAAPADAVIMIISDHGPDSQGQLLRHPRTLDSGAIKERLANLTAVRFPPDCGNALPDDVSLVNLMALMSNCVFGSHLPLTDPDFFFAPSTSVESPLFRVASPNDPSDNTSRSHT